MPLTSVELQKMLERGVSEMVLDKKTKDSLAARYRELVVLLHKRISEHSKDIEHNRKLMAAHAQQIALHNQQLKKYDQALAHIMSIPHLKGERGDTPIKGVHYTDGKNADPEEVIREVLRRLPKPKDGKDADTEAIAKAVVETIQKKKLLDISHIRNGETLAQMAQKKANADQRWHGGGISLMGRTVISGTVNGTNTVFTFPYAPSLISVDQGRFMQKTSSDGTVNWTGTNTITLTVAPNFDIFAF